MCKSLFGPNAKMAQDSYHSLSLFRVVKGLPVKRDHFQISNLPCINIEVTILSLEVHDMVERQGNNNSCSKQSGFFSTGFMPTSNLFMQSSKFLCPAKQLGSNFRRSSSSSHRLKSGQLIQGGNGEKVLLRTSKEGITCSPESHCLSPRYFETLWKKMSSCGLNCPRICS